MPTKLELQARIDELEGFLRRKDYIRARAEHKAAAANVALIAERKKVRHLNLQVGMLQLRLDSGEASFRRAEWLTRKLALVSEVLSIHDASERPQGLN